MALQNQRFVALDKQQKARILDPAEREFAARGFERASMNRILAEAGMSKGQAYYYITGKGDLYAHVFTRAFAPLVHSLHMDEAVIVDKDQFWRWVAQSFRVTSVFFLEHPSLAALGRTAYESAAALNALSISEQKLQQTFHQIICHGQTLGAIRNDLPSDFMSSLLFSVIREIDRWFALNSDAHDPKSLSSIESKALGILRRAATDG